MNTPNPLHPQGAFPDGTGRSHVRIAVFTILAVHVVLLGALLLLGCKRTTTEADTGGSVTGPLPPFVPTTNVVTPPPEIATFTPPPEVTRVEPPPSTPPPPVATPPPVESIVPINPPPVPPPVTPPVVPAAADREHTVVKGDSFYTLAKKYSVTSKAISDANPGVDSRHLRIAQKLKIPMPVEAPARTPDSAEPGNGSKLHTVGSGETLTQIAKNYGTSVKALRRDNNLRTDLLRVGQKLKIVEPTSKAAGTPVTLSPPPAIPGLK